MDEPVKPIIDTRSRRRGGDRPPPSGEKFTLPLGARTVIRFIRLIPVMVTVGFAGWAAGAALTGRVAVAAAAAAMSLLALSVAIRTR